MTSHLDEGLHLMHIGHEDLGVILYCWFDYTPASYGAREWATGVQLEPDYPATWTLAHVYLPGSNVDITPVLDDRVIGWLEAFAARHGGQPDVADELDDFDDYDHDQ